MINYQVKKRLSGTEANLKAYLYFLHAMDKKGMIEIWEYSQSYKSRGESNFYGISLEINLNVKNLWVTITVEGYHVSIFMVLSSHGHWVRSLANVMFWYL
jgi:hypothetical protein